MKRLWGRLWQVFFVLLMVLGLFYNIVYVSGGSTGGLNPRYFVTELLENEGQEAWALFADDVQLILEQSTGRFIGYYPIDDNFLAYVAATYGLQSLSDIADGGKVNPEQWFEHTGKSIHVLWYEYCQLTGIKYSEQNRIQKLPDDKDEYVFEITGDLTLCDTVATTEYMDQQMNGIADCFSKELIEYMNSADVTIVNNEFTFTTRGEPLPGKSYTFRAKPTRIHSYDTLGVDMVSLANNHVYDYGEIGLVDTLQTLTNRKIPYVGAGYNLAEAMQPYYYICGGRKVAVVAATQIERTLDFTKQATENKPGVLKSLHEELFVEEIKEASKHSDIVITIIHWGTEGSQAYGSDQQKLATAFARGGANVIVGGHTHCLQPIEYVGSVPVYYSLGNFYFSSSSIMPADYDTGIAELRIKQDRTVDAYFIPCVFSSGNISLASEKDESERILQEINHRSISAWVDSDTGYIHK